MMLPLDSPRWSKLLSSVGNGVQPAADLARLKTLLSEAISQTDSNEFEEVIDEFGYIVEDLDHQQTTYPATTAAMPHFVEVAAKLPLRQRIRALSMISMMHYDGASMRTDESDLLEWYEASIAIAASLNAAVLCGGEQLEFHQQISSLESSYLFGGDYHYMFREHSWFEYPCPECDEPLFASLIENEFWVWPAKDGYSLNEVSADRKAQVVAAADIDAAVNKPENQELQSALNIARKGGHRATIEWLSRLMGASPCPACGQQIRLAYNDFWFKDP